MSKIKCLLVDDEPPAIELLGKYADMVDQLEVVGTSHSAVKAFNLLKDKTVDLIFLDIQMPVLNGIDFIKTLSTPPSIILTTAYREYALDSYDLDIIDYLLKPISFDRFLRAIDRYRERTPVSNNVPAESSEHIFCNVNRTRHKVVLNDILYVESLKDYVRIHMQDKQIVVKGNIGTFTKQLSSQRFVRVHRSFTVALSYIDAYNQHEVTVRGQALPIGLSYRDTFLKQVR